VPWSLPTSPRRSEGCNLARVAIKLRPVRLTPTHSEVAGRTKAPPSGCSSSAVRPTCRTPPRHPLLRECGMRTLAVPIRAADHVEKPARAAALRRASATSAEIRLTRDRDGVRLSPALLRVAGRRKPLARPAEEELLHRGRAVKLQPWPQCVSVLKADPLSTTTILTDDETPCSVRSCLGIAIRGVSFRMSGSAATPRFVAIHFINRHHDVNPRHHHDGHH